MGYPGTMGAPFIDYLIADDILIPAGRQHHYAEKIITLPESYQANDDQRRIADRTPGRAELGLPEAGFVFCSFNNSHKITPAEFDIWMRLLSRVEGSVLWLLGANDHVQGNLRREAAKRGVAPARLVFAGRMPHADHLARLRQADLFLDCFQCNAHATAADALWAGVPVLTVPGEGYAARVGASLCHAIGLPELAVATRADYEQTALDLATDPARLIAIRGPLAQNRTTRPLFDSERFTRHIESAFAAAHDRATKGQPCDHIRVPALPTNPSC
jgi:predicted O-linked N-acetylglucosamine transferase (SPINDLY family)